MSSKLTINLASFPLSLARSSRSVTLVSTAALVSSLLTAACGSTPPPKELVDARATYARVSGGAAMRVVPADVQTAKEALDAAEKAFTEDATAPSTVDLAYVAERKAALADAKAGSAGAERQKAEAQKGLQQTQTQRAQAVQGELSQTKDALRRERQARTDAERRAKEAMDNLARIAAIKDEPRGMVITLSGSVLFASGKAELLPVAQEKLNQVAQALKEQEDATMVVEGHTDSLGPASVNQELSLKRAQSVREYLVSRGIPPERVTASGIGPDRPIADNKTAEGRANNRRVEIVVQPRAKK